MAAAIRAPKGVWAYTGGAPELFVLDEETGTDRRCRPDFLLAKGIIVDLKSTEDAQARKDSRGRWQITATAFRRLYSNGVYQAIGEYPAAVYLSPLRKRLFAVACYTLTTNKERDMNVPYDDACRMYQNKYISV